MNKIINITFVALFTMALSSCSIYKKYESPDLEPLSEDLYALMDERGDTTSIASIPWKSFFSEPKLQGLIEKALKNNTDLKVAELSIEQASQALKTARLSFLPSFNLNPSVGYSTFDGNSTKTYALSVSASWEVDLFGKIRNAKQKQKAIYEQTKAYHNAVQTQLIASVAGSYYSLLLLDEQLRISKLTKKNWQETIKSMQALMDAGRINESGVLSTKASAKALDAQIVALEMQVKNMELAISGLLAIAPQGIERGKLSGFKMPEDLKVGLPISLVSNRSDVRVAEYSLISAYYASAEARSALYPSLTLSGLLGFTNNGAGVSNPGGILINAAASLLQPIFNAKSLRSQVNISDLQQEQALLNFKQTVLDAALEVNSALNGVQAAEKLIATDKQQISLLKRSLKSTQLLMEHGSVNYLEVLTSQNSLLSAELSLSEDLYSQIQSTIDLYRSLGGGNN